MEMKIVELENKISLLNEKIFEFKQELEEILHQLDATPLMDLEVTHKKFGEGKICKEYINEYNNEKLVDITFPSKTVSFALDSLPKYVEFKNPLYLNLAEQKILLMDNLQKLQVERDEATQNWQKLKVEQREMECNIFCFGDDFDSDFFDMEYPSRIEIDDIKFASVGNYLLFKGSESDIYFCDGPRMRNRKKVREMRMQLEALEDKFWIYIREELAFRALLAKFEKPKYKRQLLATGNKTLVYCSEDDLVWGAGVSATSENRFNSKLWPGKNLLGKALEDVRSFLRENITSKDIYFSIETDEYGTQKTWYYFTSSDFEPNSLCGRWDTEAQYWAFHSAVDNYRDEYKEQFEILKNEEKTLCSDSELTSYELFKYRVKRMKELGIPLR